MARLILVKASIQRMIRILPRLLHARLRVRTPAFSLDMPLNQYRWEGTEGLWEDFLEECESKNIVLPKAEGLEAAGPTIMGEIAYWCGCVYREWHFRDGLWSEEMFELLPPDVLMYEYVWGHTMMVETWLDLNLDRLITDAAANIDNNTIPTPEK